jgi:glycosyltransferase involved in cell wall biosynthesis
MTLSAIVPTCNRPAMLERALRSIAAQEIAPTEVIVVDDSEKNNQDAVRRVVEESGLAPLRLVANSHTKGASGTRNTGTEFAASELLAFLDDDDEWLPSYLSAVLNRFESQHLDVICADLLCQFEDGVDRPGKSAPDKISPELFFTRNPGLGGSNLAIRQCVYRHISGFDESLPTCEDRDFGLRLSLCRDVRYQRLDMRLVRYHAHNGTRLCNPNSETIRVGISRFYELHAHRMSNTHREEFRREVRRQWGIDEHGQILNLSPTTFGESLLPLLKARLDQKKGLG